MSFETYTACLFIRGNNSFKYPYVCLSRYFFDPNKIVFELFIDWTCTVCTPFLSIRLGETQHEKNVKDVTKVEHFDKNNLPYKTNVVNLISLLASRVDYSLPILYYGSMSNFKRYYQDKNIVFITIVTYNRQQILVKNIELLRQSFKNVKYNYEIIAGIVLPDHLHILIQTDKTSDYSKIISSFKSNFSRLLPKNINQTEAQLDRREKGIWQRKYYDHIIRDENDFNKYLDYIHYNSVKHLNISPKDWEFSSFKKFVKQGFYQENWCNFDDKNGILNMDLE